VDHCVAQRIHGHIPEHGLLAAEVSGSSDTDLSAEVQAIQRDTNFELLQPPGVQQQTGVDSISPRVQTLLRAGENLSLARLGGSIVDTLGHRNYHGAAAMIEDELPTVLWNPDWKLDPSMANIESSHQEAIRAGASKVVRRLQFEAFQAREAAIADSILQTYSWIYDREGTRPGGEALKWSCFPDWLETPALPTYWITGRPGSGKSTIMKLIQRNPALSTHLGKWASNLPLVITSYYAWNSGTTPQKSLQGLQRTLLCQALELKPELLPILAPRLWAFFQITGGWEAALRSFAWGDWEVDQSFKALLAESGNTLRLVIFIDGLDEFDIPPKEVVQMVNSITSSSQDGVKMCVASRPWVEFDDAYRDVPQLEMNLHTGGDMEIFVSESFRSCKAFLELKGIYPEQAGQLLREIVHKANGVFIWLRVVVEALVESATEGAGMMELEAIFDSLPSDMCALYDALWARIPDQACNRGAILLHLVKAVGQHWPLNWLTIWLADEFALHSDLMETVDISNLKNEQTSIESMKLSLRRKLASRTRGLLELSEVGDVGFAHRTASEWVARPKVWQDICARCPPGFDPYLYFVQLSSLAITSTKLSPPTHDLIRNTARRTLYCASCVSGKNAGAVTALIRALDCFDERMEKVAGGLWHDSIGDSWWSKKYTFGSRFIVLAAHFCILPYLKGKMEADPWSIFQRGTRSTIGTLEAVVFFPEESPSQSDTARQVDYAKRIETVRFLYEIGVEQRYYYAYKSRVIEKILLRSTVKRGWTSFSHGSPADDTKYRAEVREILGAEGLRTALRLAAMRLKSLKSSG
jgi:hypothetical protein